MPSREVAAVWRPSGVRFELFGCVIEAAGIGVRGTQTQAICESSDERGLQAVVFPDADWVGVLDVAEVGVGRFAGAEVINDQRLIEVR